MVILCLHQEHLAACPLASTSLIYHDQPPLFEEVEILLVKSTVL